MKNLEKIKNDYINHLKKFIEKNNLETDFLEDIEERINEKITKIENPTQDDLRKILKEIGTPEEIFSEVLGGKMEKVPKNFWEKILQKSKKVIFLGVFYELGIKTGISANIFRILFLFLIFIGFLGNGVLIPVLFFIYFIGFLLLRTGIFRFFFALFLGFLCILICLPAIFLLGIYLSNFHIENIYPFLEISGLLPIGLGIGIFSMIVLAIFFIHFAFSGKTFGIKFFLTGIISFVIAITIGIGIGADLFSKYYGFQRTEKNFVFEKNNLKNIDFRNFAIKTNIDLNGPNVQIINHNLYYPNITFSNDDKVHITIEENKVGNKIFIEKYKNFIKNYNLDLKEGEFILNVEIDTKNKYPLIPVNFSTKNIEIPKNIIFYSNYWNLSDKEIIFPEKEKNEKFAGTVFKLCEKYFFDENGKLNCEAKEAERIIKQTKENFMEKEKN